MGLLTSLPPFIAAPLACIIILAVLVRLFYNPTLRRNNQALRRAPDSIPLLGNALHFLRDQFDLIQWFAHCEALFPHETLQISVPTLPPGVIISSPANVEYALKHENIFGKGEFLKERSQDLFGHGIVNVDGDLWKLQRKAGLSFLGVANLKILTDVELPHILSDSIASLKSTILKDPNPAGHALDLQAFFLEITTQLMGHMAYGMEMHAQDPFSTAFEYASAAISWRIQNPLWRISEFLFGERVRTALAMVHTFGREIVTNAMHARKDLEPGQKVKGTGSLIHSLLDSIGDQKIVADAALNYLSAGRDTTAQSLTWASLLLAQNPSVLTRIRAEVSAADEISPQSLPYTLAVFYESLRFYPPVPIELKQVQSPVTLPDGTFLPKSSILIWSTWAMNRSKATWGPDAAEFRPERWLTLVNGVSTFIHRSTGEFPVFNGGPRMCLGKKMAESVFVKTIAAVVMDFDFTLNCSPNRRSSPSLTLPMENGLPVHAKIRTY